MNNNNQSKSWWNTVSSYVTDLFANCTTRTKNEELTLDALKEYALRSDTLKEYEKPLVDRNALIREELLQKVEEINELKNALEISQKQVRREREQVITEIQFMIDEAIEGAMTVYRAAQRESSHSNFSRSLSNGSFGSESRSNPNAPSSYRSNSSGHGY